MVCRYLPRRLLGAIGYAFAAFASFAAIDPACAQETHPDFYKEPGIYPNRDYLNQHVSENIDPFTGSLEIQSTDVYLPGIAGFDLKVVRSYNTTRINPANPADLTTSSIAGLGWTVHFGRVLRKANGNPCANANAADTLDNPVLELPDGSRQVLAYTPTGSPAMLTTQRWRAECIGSTGLAVYSPDGVRYDMTQHVLEVAALPTLHAWYTRTITDRNGHSATVSYAAAGSPEITQVSASDGRLITFTYFDSATSSRRINTITQGSRVWSYQYQSVTGVGGRYHLTAVIRPDTAQTRWQYAYHPIVFGDSPNNYQMQRMTYPQGGTVTYGYQFVNFDRVTNPATRSVVVTQKTTSDGGTWTFAYCPARATGCQVDYDRTTVTTPAAAGAAGTITYRHFSANAVANGTVWKIGLLASKTIGTLQTETLSWGSQKISDEDHKRPGAFPNLFDSQTDAPILLQRAIVRDSVSYQTSYSNHDSYGNPQTVAESGPNGGSRSTALTYYINTAKWIIQQVDDETTTSGGTSVGSIVRNCDANGNLLSETRDGVQTSYTRHATGEIWTRTDPRGFVTTLTNYFRGIAQNETQPENVNVSRVVSDAGNVTSETDGEGFATLYGYDGLNRLASIAPPVGAATTIGYSATQQTATRDILQQVTTLDGFGRPLNVTSGGFAVAASYDSLGRKSFGSIVGYPTIGHSFQYDVLNRVTRITHNADNSYRQFTYGALGGVPTLAVRNERNFTTTHAYRAYGDPDKALVMSIAAPTGLTAANVTLTRDHRGLVRSAVQDGKTRTFGYDSRYYLTSTTQPETGTTIYGRDNAGNMTSKQVGWSGTSIFEYDGRGRLWRVSYPNASPSTVVNEYWKTDKLKAVTNAVATRTYTYDGNQNLRTETLVVDGLTLAATYNYNGRDQLASIVYPVFGRTVSFSPNALGRPTNITGSLGSMLNTAFWPNGQVYDIAFVGGSRVTYGMNTREWLNSVTVATGDAVNRVASTLLYDVAGNLTGVTDSVDGSYNRTLGHDAINRLVSAAGPWGSGLISYDGSGNLTLMSFGGTNHRTYFYDAPTNRLQQSRFEISGVTQSSVFYGYDAYGNASANYTEGIIYSGPYTYDNASNLVIPGAQRAFSYDGANTRVKTVGGALTTYEFRSAHGLLLAEWRKQPGYYDRLKEHMHLAGREVVEQQTDFIPGGSTLPSTLMFLQHDANGSPIAATWAGGGLLFKENYQPYGSRINGTAAPYTQRAFTGQKQDSADLIHMGGRYYNPQTGRFLSIDPKQAEPSDLHGLNRYAYGNNNPYRYVDPDGYTPVDLAFFAVDAVKLGVALYTGAGVGAAAVDLALSTVGVFSPVPGTGQVLKGLKAADKAIDAVKSADRAVDVGRATAAKGGKNYVDGYRAVSKAEADDIAKHGFRPDPSGRSMQDKWFSETRQGAEQFRKTYPDLQEVVKTKVPRDVYDRSFKHPNIDNTGPGFCVQCADLRHLPKP